MENATPPKPSILDKLLAGAIEDGVRPYQHCYVPRLDRFAEADLRAVIQRDVSSILNDIHFEAAVPLDDYPEVRTSVLNHGLPELIGRSLSPVAMSRRSGEVSTALQAFEQRLRPETVTVAFDAGLVNIEHKLHFSIVGEIRNAIEESWIQFSSTVDLEDGRVEIET